MLLYLVGALLYCARPMASRPDRVVSHLARRAGKTAVLA